MSVDRARADWWRDATFYQIYIRSFFDADGDGVGDIAGIRAKLDYVQDLGVDAIWVNPWYASPMADGGYDVADYRAVDPLFGCVEDARALIADVHERGLRIIADIVPNHTSVAHPWFIEALNGSDGSSSRDRYIFREGRTPSTPPNDWDSVFAGPAWTQVEEGGSWYLHLFAPEQPDLNWRNEEVAEEFDAIFNFWFDLGIDGFRIDVAHGLVKQEGMPDFSSRDPMDLLRQGDHPYWDRPEVHNLHRRWRSLADRQEHKRVLVAEAWVASQEHLALYVRSDELHLAFNFDFMMQPWRIDSFRGAIDRTLFRMGEIGAPPTWVLSNHDVVRHPSRYGRPSSVWEQGEIHRAVGDVDLELGQRRARSALLLMLSLPGAVFLYQGEELGLPEVEDLPDTALKDPNFLRSGGKDRGRDGCRVPLPWGGDRPPFGFSVDSTPEAVPPKETGGTWLPQPTGWASLTVDAQSRDEDSMLSLYKQALRLRAGRSSGDAGTASVSQDGEVLIIDRPNGWRCLVNFGAVTHVVEAGWDVELASYALPDEHERLAVPADGAVWMLRTS